ncbi:kinase-like domain-containing protein [Clohesyomyces aquaticus]|uniref:non-specific serine/threonine protein kinase n=1 Tax=Clohesyomyces aquaticus TaxID=1231657 RepID=A0A1Y1ZRQ1_9PLEO|nr:kinase-like domain-containing protein [Clohesyomyces aquaticus]
MAAPERVGLSKRVGSFVRNKLHRTPSTKDVPGSSSVHNEQVFVKTGVDGPAEVSSPPVNIPKYRRLSSFSLSARTTPKSSQGNSPPSPSSPTSTISNEETSPGQKPRLGHKHSASSSTLVAMDKQQPRPGITWAGGGKDGKKNSRFARRRSASTETVPKLANADQTVGLIDTFSKPAAEGVGMKARRLSMSLPDEFVVDTCDLEKEFKSSSVMPGKRGKCLGRGATAEVRIMARKGASGEDLVAVKEFRVREKDEREDDYVKKIQSEYSIAKSLHHPNIVETVRLCTNRGRWNHVMEFCQYGELFSLVERKLFSGGEGGYYSVGDRLCLFKQLLRGVDYLHSHGIAHRDIKLENLLMDKDGHLKISDFGVAEVFSGEHPGLRAAGGECGKNMGEVRLSKPGICGSLPYIAPEVLAKNGEYDPRPLDVWSCAIVYLTMTFGGCPWQAAKTEFEYYARFKKGWDEWLPNHPDGQIFDGPDGQPKCGKLFSMINPPPVKRLLLKMLHPIPEKRITIAEVVKTPVVKGIECCCPESFEDPTHTIDTSKCTAKEMSKMRVTQKHTHKPPKPESRVAKALTHRWDMGDGWT